MKPLNGRERQTADWALDILTFSPNRLVFPIIELACRRDPGKMGHEIRRLVRDDAHSAHKMIDDGALMSYMTRRTGLQKKRTIALQQ